MVSSSGQSSLEISTLPPIIKPYMDASVFMAHIKEEKVPCRGRTRIDITRDLFSDAERGLYKIHTSFLTIAEVRRLKEAGKSLEPDELPTAQRLFTRYIENQWIEPIVVDRPVSEKAQELGAVYGMSPTDAIHLASAILWQCNVLMVWDKGTFTKHFSPDEPVEGVCVIEPYWEGVQQMEPEN